MTFRQWIGPLLLAAAILSCSTPVRRAEPLLSEETFRSSDGSLQGLVPRGWFASTDPELTPHLLAWIVRNDYGATLSLQEIKVDSATVSEVGKNGLAILAEISFRLKKTERPSAQQTSPPRVLESGDRGMCRYEFMLRESGIRGGVVVLRIGSRFFESSVLPVKSPDASDEYQRLLEVQEAVAGSLR